MMAQDGTELGIPRQERDRVEDGPAVRLWRHVLASIRAARAERETRRVLRHLDRRLLEDIGAIPPGLPSAQPPGIGFGDAVLALLASYGRKRRPAREGGVHRR